jgi:hypothetical protein
VKAIHFWIWFVALLAIGCLAAAIFGALPANASPPHWDVAQAPSWEGERLCQSAGGKWDFDVQACRDLNWQSEDRSWCTQHYCERLIVETGECQGWRCLDGERSGNSWCEDVRDCVKPPTTPKCMERGAVRR